MCSKYVVESLVEWDRVAEEGVDDVGVVVQLLVDHQGKDAHLGGTAVVELDGELLVDGLLVPSGGLELSLLDLVLAGGEATLDGGNSQKGAEDGLHRKVSQSGKTSLNVGQVVAGGQAGGKAVASGGDKVAKDGKLGNAAVLGLNGAEAIELLLVSIFQQTQRIPEACAEKQKIETNISDFEESFDEKCS